MRKLLYRFLLITALSGCHENFPEIPNAAFDYQTDKSDGKTVTFTSTSSGAASYAWNFGDGDSTKIDSGEPVVKHTYLNKGTYHVKLIARGAKEGSSGVSKSITIDPKPVGDFSVTNDNCGAPCEVSFTNNFTYGESYLWDFGDKGSSTDKNPTHRYEKEGVYQVKLTVKTQTGSTTVSTGSVTIKKTIPVAVINSDKDNCEVGCTINFTSTGSVNAKTFLWNFGDGGTSTLENPSYTFKTTGKFTVKLTVTAADGITQDSKTKDITISIQPKASFEIIGDNLKAPAIFNFRSTATNANTYDWNFGDGTSSSDNKAAQQHIYLNKGTYNVTLKVTSVSGQIDNSNKSLVLGEVTKPNDYLMLDFLKTTDVKEWVRQYNLNGNAEEILTVSDSHLNMSMKGNNGEVVYGIKHNYDLSGLNSFLITTRFGKESIKDGTERLAHVKFAIKEYGGDISLDIYYDGGVRKLRVARKGKDPILKTLNSACEEVTFTLQSVNGIFTLSDNCTNSVWFADAAQVTLNSPAGVDIYYGCGSGGCTSSSFGSVAIDYIHVQKYP